MKIEFLTESGDYKVTSDSSFDYYDILIALESIRDDYGVHVGEWPITIEENDYDETWELYFMSLDSYLDHPELT